MASAQDMARFGIALMDDGMLDGQRVMASESVRRMTTGSAAIPGTRMARYGYGLSIDSLYGTRVWSHGGAINGFDANVTMFPDRRVAVVILDNRGGNPIVGLTPLVAREVARLAVTEPPALPAPRTPSAAERTALAGAYLQGRTRFDLEVRGEQLVLRRGDATLPVQMIGTDRITFATPGGAATTMVLVRDAQGRVAYLHQSLRALARQ